MIEHAPGRFLTSRALGMALALAALLCASQACSSSKSKETPEQRVESGLAAYQAEIHKVVKDPARAEQLVELSSEFQRLVEQAARSIQSYRAQVATLNADYGATLAEFEALFSQQDAQRAALAEKALDLRARMAAITTESEWEALKKARIAEWQNDLADVQSSY